LCAERAGAEEVLASWYGPGYYGLPTASGEPYDVSGYTASHETLPFGTELEVGYGGKSVLVTVNDRGDFPGERELDLSQAAAQEHGPVDEPSFACSVSKQWQARRGAYVRASQCH